MSYSAVKVYLSAIRHHQISNSLGDPGISRMARLEYILKGVRRDGATSTATPRKERQPITPIFLKKLFTAWKNMPNLSNSKMLWAAACLAFFAFLRVGEFTSPTTDKYDPKVHLSFSDISTDNQQSPSMVFVQLKQSKTDQLRKGVTIVLGRTKQFLLCPVSSLMGYLVVRGNTPGPLFTWSNGTFITRAQFVEEVKKALDIAGVDAANFNGHSFRIGAASTAAANGMEDSMIKTLGRWESEAYQRYIKIPREELANYTITLASD